MRNAKSITVLVIDDSALVRQVMGSILSECPLVKEVITASNPYIAVKKMQKKLPNVIILDIEMPQMDGITFLTKLMKYKPLPVIICSGATNKDTALMALDKGAVDIIEKPKVGTKTFLEESKTLLCDMVLAAAASRVKKAKTLLKPIRVEEKLTADVIVKRIKKKISLKSGKKIIVVGASTGGTEALRVFLEALPEDVPGILVVQHMPAHFTYMFAQRLDSICRVGVREARDGDVVSGGTVLIAPGNRHMLLNRRGKEYFVEIKDGPLVSRHRPSVDVLFRSAANCAGADAIAIIMTGMGDDGARGMLELKQAGAYCIAQDEATSVVYGMPKEAAKLGAVDIILPLHKIASHVVNMISSQG